MKLCHCAEWISTDKAGANVYRCRKHEIIYIRKSGFVGYEYSLHRKDEEFEKWWFWGY